MHSFSSFWTNQITNQRNYDIHCHHYRHRSDPEQHQQYKRKSKKNISERIIAKGEILKLQREHPDRDYQHDGKNGSPDNQPLGSYRQNPVRINICERCDKQRIGRGIQPDELFGLVFVDIELRKTKCREQCNGKYYESEGLRPVCKLIEPEKSRSRDKPAGKRSVPLPRPAFLPAGTARAGSAGRER